MAQPGEFCRKASPDITRANDTDFHMSNFLIFIFWSHPRILLARRCDSQPNCAGVIQQSSPPDHIAAVQKLVLLRPQCPHPGLSSA
jgi:hypothetical protein